MTVSFLVLRSNPHARHSKDMILGIWHVLGCLYNLSLLSHLLRQVNCIPPERTMVLECYQTLPLCKGAATLDTPAITTKALTHWCFDCKSGFITTEIQLLCQQANSSSVKVMKHLNSNPICNRSTLCSLNFVFDVSKSLSPLKLWYCELDCYA